MGNCAENTAKKFGITRKDQDDYAINSYKRSAAANESKVFHNELITINVLQKQGNPTIAINEDEEYKRVNFDMFQQLPTAFQVNILRCYVYRMNGLCEFSFKFTSIE